MRFLPVARYTKLGFSKAMPPLMRMPRICPGDCGSVKIAARAEACGTGKGGGGGGGWMLGLVAVDKTQADAGPEP